jgi:hypothetical protein
MKSLFKKQGLQFVNISYLILMSLLIIGGIAFAADEGDSGKIKTTTDGLTIVDSTRFTETDAKTGINWSDYTKYQIAPVEVSFRKDWKKDYNRDHRDLTMQVTDKDMARIKETMAKVTYEEFDKELQRKSGLTKVDEADSHTLIFKPKVINLDVFAPDVQRAQVISPGFIRQVGRATLFLDVHDAVSGEILARWVDTREAPDNGYYEWANRITNADQVRRIVRDWAKNLIEGLEKLKAVN